MDDDPQDPPGMQGRSSAACCSAALSPSTRRPHSSSPSPSRRRSKPEYPRGSRRRGLRVPAADCEPLF